MASAATNWKPVRMLTGDVVPPNSSLGSYARPVGSSATRRGFGFRLPFRAHPAALALGTVGAGAIYLHGRRRREEKRQKFLTTLQGRKLRPSVADIIASERLSRQ